jgi:X-X-X-Leu-X-X-Gly heptad repeat protein
MPYPESCPECGSQFRNTGTHFTARRNEVGRHVLLELGCQNTNRRYWWDFTAGQLGENTKATPVLASAGATAATATNGTHNLASGNGQVASGNGHVASSNGHVAHPKLSLAATAPPPDPAPSVSVIRMTPEPSEPAPAPVTTDSQSSTLKDAFVRQLQLDRMTLRQMRSLLMSDEARRSIEVAVGATEATYERLALILFGSDLQQLLGKAAVAPATPGMSAEERLELQREKARIRARLRRAAIKAAKQAT